MLSFCLRSRLCLQYIVRGGRGKSRESHTIFFVSFHPPCRIVCVCAALWQDLRSLEVSWALSFASLEERQKFRDARPFTYIGTVLVRRGSVGSFWPFSFVCLGFTRFRKSYRFSAFVLAIGLIRLGWSSSPSPMCRSASSSED